VEIFASQGATLVSTTLVENFATSFAIVVDTDDNFATNVNDTSSKFAVGVDDIDDNLPPVSTTPAANFATSFTNVVDTGGKFAAGVNDTSGKNVSIS
jgi:hypothetical protein